MLVDGASDTATNLSRASGKATSFTMLGFILLLMASPLRAAPSSLGPLQEDETDELPTFDMTLEGDIMTRNASDPSFANAHLANPEMLWPGGVIEYAFYRTFPSEHRTAMKQAMSLITSRSPCVTFVPATEETINFVVITTGPNCSSEIGMRGKKQLLWMNAGCFENGLIIPVHELLHVAGFIHEHTRPDRDDYIEINHENIEPEMRPEFKIRPHGDADFGIKGSVNAEHSPYDVASVTHYGPTHGSKNGEEVIRFRHELPNTTWHEPTPDDPLSLIDQVELSMAYKCEEQMNHTTLLRYIHQNRNHNSLKMNTMGALIEELKEEEEKMEVAVAKGIVDARNLIDEKMEQEEEKMRAAVAKGIADARSYTNTKIDDAKADVKSYTNSEIVGAKAYTNTEVATATKAANSYTNTKVATATKAAKAYTNTKVATATKEANRYTNTKIDDAKADVKSYTNSEIVGAKAYTNTKVATATKAANSYTNTKVYTATHAANSYTNRKVATEKGVLTRFFNSKIVQAKSDLSLFCKWFGWNVYVNCA